MVTGKPPFDGETPTAVMHKHLKQPLTPPDHLNTSLSAGVGEIIEYCMAKNRDERYHSTSDLLEDLQAVRAGDAPMHARQAVDLDSLEAIEKTAQTVDLDPQPSSPDLWSNPLVVALMAVCGASLLVNIILLVVFLTRA
jgi:serine/threonine-protein kinase